MIATVLKGVRDLGLVEKPIPIPKEGEVLVRVRAVGVCGSDVHGFEGLIPQRRKLGLIMGHEVAGEVEDGGDSSVWRKGDRVAVNPQVYCGDCYSCSRGWFHLCDRRLNLGSSMNTWFDGALCEYLAIPGRQLHRLPQKVSYGEGAVAEPASCAVHMIERGRLESGGTVVIIGTGTIGLIAVQVAAQMDPAKLIVVDKLDQRLTIAKKLGAEVLINPAKEDPVERIMAETEGRGADVTFEAAGLAITYDWAIRSLRKRGTLLALGFIDEQVPFDMRHLIFREITVVGSTGFTSEIDEALKLIGGGRVDVKPLITHEFSLEDAQVAFETASDPNAGAIKVMIYPDHSGLDA